MPVLLPAALDLDAHLAAHPATFPGFRRENLFHLLHLVSYLPLANRKVAARLPDHRGFVPLRAARLRRWLPDYRDYLHYCLATDLLVTDNFYLEPNPHRKGKCRGYQFTAAYRPAAPDGEGPAGPGLVLHEVPEPPSLTRVKRRYAAAAKRSRPAYGPLLSWLDAGRTPLRIDREAAERFVAAELERVRHDPSLRERRRRRKRKAAQKRGRRSPFKDPEAQALQRRLSIVKLAAGELDAHVDSVGRLHSTLTSLSSKLRPFVYCEGHGRLVALDLRTSQPYLGNILLRGDFYEAPYSKGRKGSQVPLFIRREGQFGRTSPDQTETLARHCAEILQRADHQCESRFREWTSAGDFYLHLHRALWGGASARPLDRDALKRMVLTVLFSDNASRAPVLAAFAQLFPTVAAIFRACKQRRANYLPLLLQRLEAVIFLEKIAGRLARARPDMPLFSLHDSLVVPEAHVDFVRRVMAEELRRYVGAEPHLKVSYWGQDPAVQG
ncbi:hypothetical protein LJY25_03455 [Hymenobacter sp. BT175]|uniref:hypothetical protein n=1 Tax=Hymenobacter translucens TaxID=2886507 RepID=UPI001D0E4EDC|nr:hypothetical protein [Hymenobacter translucens]MCC2545487.1 hypothetical protein [Hymenobacter translucens]